MTEVTTTLQSAYLAGPMRGYDEFNFPAFHREAAWLRSKGWKVFSPAERDEADPVLNGEWAVGKQRGLDYYMQYDLAAVCQTDAVILMRGWEESQGARLEAAVATEIGHPVFEILESRIGYVSPYSWRKRLAYVETDRIITLFYDRSVAISDLVAKTLEVVS